MNHSRSQLEFIGLSEITNTSGKEKGDLLKRWLNLEDYPDIIAAEVLELTNEALAVKNSAVSNSSVASDDASQQNLDETFPPSISPESTSTKMDIQSSLFEQTNESWLEADGQPDLT